MHEQIRVRLTALPGGFQALEDEAVTEGFAMITRLRTDWEGGVRFDGPGELLLGAFRGGRLIGIGGLSRDPYLSDPRVGRLRHLYVMAGQRGTGTGRGLVVHLLAHAAGHFNSVRLWSARAGAFYEALGFLRVDGPKVTHVCVIPRARGGC
jgi:GNAT superfamily N-acetyltransferase